MKERSDGWKNDIPGHHDVYCDKNNERGINYLDTNSKGSAKDVRREDGLTMDTF